MDRDDKDLIKRYIGTFAFKILKRTGKDTYLTFQRQQEIESRNFKQKLCKISIILILLVGILIFSVLRLTGVYHGIF